mgnify:CR=1 FL=1
MTNEIIKVEPIEVSEESWKKAEYLFKYNVTMTVSQIAKETGILESAIEERAKARGWTLQRTFDTVKTINANLQKVTKAIAGQINELNGHSVAMLKAVQYSHRIRITKDAEGELCYMNFPDWVDRPPDFDKKSKEEQEALLLTISPARLEAFFRALGQIFNLKLSLVRFIASMVKADFPKIDPSAININRNSDVDIINDTPIFLNNQQSSDRRLLSDLLAKEDRIQAEEYKEEDPLEKKKGKEDVGE